MLILDRFRHSGWYIASIIHDVEKTDYIVSVFFIRMLKKPRNLCQCYTDTIVELSAVANKCTEAAIEKNVVWIFGYGDYPLAKTFGKRPLYDAVELYREVF